jgi:hypothetical protein
MSLLLFTGFALLLKPLKKHRTHTNEPLRKQTLKKLFEGFLLFEGLGGEHPPY